MRQLPLFESPTQPERHPPRKVFALVDCNNFYVSCERVFDWTIRNRPVIVLGNNDGCVVARSQEVKRIGIPMGMPLWECRHLVERHQIAVYSSNYALYQDMSDRVMRVIAKYTSQIEIYSIDESWLDFSHVEREELSTYAKHLQSQVDQWTGIPVSIGMAHTKVLAKVACELAKQRPETSRIVDLTAFSEQQIDDLLGNILVEDLWGIGSRLAARLNTLGIITARTLKAADHAWLRHQLGVTVQRIVLELRGISCLPIQSTAKPRQAMMVSQSFGRPIESLPEMLEAIAHYSVRAGEKLRRHHQQTKCLSIFIRTNPFDKKAAQYTAGASTTFLLPTAYTPDLIGASQQLVRQVFQRGYRYKKAGVYLSDLHPEEVIQPDLFGAFSWEEEIRRARLMLTIDSLNERWGRDTVFFCAQGIRREWQMQQRRRSPSYTTRWQDVLSVT